MASVSGSGSGIDSDLVIVSWIVIGSVSAMWQWYCYC